MRQGKREQEAEQAEVLGLTRMKHQCEREDPEPNRAAKHLNTIMPGSDSLAQGVSHTDYQILCEILRTEKVRPLGIRPSACNDRLRLRAV